RRMTKRGQGGMTGDPRLDHNSRGRIDELLLAVGVALLLLLIVLVAYGGWWRDAAVQPPNKVGDTGKVAAHFVGSATCAGCHTQAYQDWLGSHHQLAMRPASADNV